MNDAAPTKTIAHTEDVRRTIRTMSLGALWRVLRYPFILLSLAIIPRLMGDADYGRYAYFISLFVMLDMMTDLGIQQIFGRFVPECEAGEDASRTRALLHGILGFGVVLALVMVAGLALVHLVRPLAGFSFHWIVLMSLMLVLTRIEGTLFCFIYGLNQIARFSAKEALRSACTLVLVVVLYRAYGLTGALWGLVINEIILCVLSAAWTRSYLRPRPSTPLFQGLRPYLIFGISFYVPAFFFGLLQRSGNVLVQMLSGVPEEVAYYDIANQYLLLTVTFLGLIFQTLLPALTKLHIGNDTMTIDRWQRTIMTYCAILAFLSFNALMWLGEPVILLWLGESFRPVIANAQVIAIAVVPGLVAYAGMNYALLHKAPSVYMAAVATGGVVMVVACLALVPSLNSLGASWATVAGYVALGLVFIVRYLRYFRVILRDFWLAVGVALLFLPLYRLGGGGWDSVLWFGGTSVLYGLILMVVRVVRWSDLEKILAAFRKRA